MLDPSSKLLLCQRWILARQVVEIGKPEAAERALIRRTLAITERASARSIPTVAIRLNNLALLFLVGEPFEFWGYVCGDAVLRRR